MRVQGDSREWVNGVPSGPGKGSLALEYARKKGGQGEDE